MYYLGSFGTVSRSKVITVQERMRLLREREKRKLIEEENKEENKTNDRKNKRAIYIPSKYI